MSPRARQTAVKTAVGVASEASLPSLGWSRVPQLRHLGPEQAARTPVLLACRLLHQVPDDLRQLLDVTDHGIVDRFVPLSSSPTPLRRPLPPFDRASGVLVLNSAPP